MVWAPALVLMTVASSAIPAKPLASTYDEAACPPIADTDEPARAALADEPVGSCSEPAPVLVAPAMVDCNDPGMSPWVEEMIGSCDMPRPAPPFQGPLMVVKSTRGSPTSRVCNGLHCANESSPLHNAPRPDEDSAQLLVSTIAVGYWPAVSALDARVHEPRGRALPAPPEPPPRA